MPSLAKFKNLRTWIQQVSPKLSSGAGLLLILGSILYLLAGFSAALDAISFQDRVLRVVGDDNRMQARSVLNKLDELRRNEPSGRPSNAENLPIETLALQLDRVKAATNLLGTFDEAILPPDDAGRRATITIEQSDIIRNWLTKRNDDSQSEPDPESDAELGRLEIIDLLQQLDLADEAEQGKSNTQDLMQGLGNNLMNELNLLNTEISNNVRGIKLVRSLDKIENLLDQISTFKDGIPAATDNVSGTTDPVLASNLAADQLKERLAQLGVHLGQMESSINSSEPDGAQAKQHFDNAMLAYDQIRPMTQGSAQRIESNFDEIAKSLETIKGNVADIETLIAEPKPEALNAMFGKLQADAENIQALLVTRDSANPEIDDQTEDVFEEFKAHTKELATHVRTTLPEFETIQKITPALAKMEIASNALSRLVVDSERINTVVDGQTVVGFEAANIYKKQVEALSEAVAEMTSSLEELSDEGLLAQLLTDDPEALAKAGTLLRDHEKISRAEFPLNVWGWKLIDPAVLSVASREKLDIMMVLIVGAIGSMIYMTQRMLKLTMHGQASNVSQRMPLLWYLARPVFGAVVAFAVYLIYQTGQIAFGTGGLTEALENGINIPVLTVIGLFAGLLSWQALDMIQSKGEVWLNSGTHEPLWATGLARVLEAKGHTEEHCSQHLGVTIGQIDRWISYKDKVVPEMQDRLSTWLGVKSEDLFSATSLARTQNETPMYAVGLKPFLQRIDAHQSIRSIALALGVKDELVERWRDQKQPVSGEYQWQLVELVKERFARFYSAKVMSDRNWAVGLRESMSHSDYPNATTLASKLQIAEQWVQKWRDLYEPVPASTAELIAETLEDQVYVLFDSHFDHLADQFKSANPTLLKAILSKYVPDSSGDPSSDPSGDPSSDIRKAVSAFARDMDVGENWVNDWLNGERPIFSPTRKAAALKLGQDESTLFEKRVAERNPASVRTLREPTHS